MADITICIDEFPTYSMLFNLFNEQLLELFRPNFSFPDSEFKFPPFKINFPDTLTVTKDMFGSTFFSPSVFIIKYVGALVKEFLLMLLKIIFEVLEPLLGAIPMPKIPCLNVDIWDIFSGNLGDVHTTCSCGQKVPQNLDSPIQTPVNVSDCITGYLKTLSDLTVGLIGNLIGYLEDLELDPPGMPTFPEIPTKADILALLPEFPTYEDLFDLSFPGVDMSLLLPNPLIEFSKPGSFEVEEGIDILLQKLTMIPLQLMFDFLNILLGLLGLSISLPLLCFTFPITPT